MLGASECGAASATISWSIFGSDVLSSGIIGVLFARFCLVRLWSRCPLMVANDGGGYLASVCLVRPGNPLMYSFRSASARVVIGGLKSVAWLNSTRSDGLAA